MAIVDRAQALQFFPGPASPWGIPHPPRPTGCLPSWQWSDVAGSVGFAVILSPFRSGFTILSSAVLGTSLNLLVPQLSHLYSGDNITACLRVLVCELTETE